MRETVKLTIGGTSCYKNTQGKNIIKDFLFI